MADRPMSPPAAEIAAQAWDRYGEWEAVWSATGDLDDVEPEDRPFIYGYMRHGIDIDMAKMMAETDRAMAQKRA